MKKTLILLLTLSLLLVSCGTTADLWSTATYTGDATVGEGEKSVTVTVEAQEKTVTLTVYYDDGELLSEPLLENHLIVGENGDYGLYVTSVNGITADYNKDGSYWMLYINGEIAPTGVSQTTIRDGETYEFIYTK